ncbi:MAG: hypothetical protein WCE52_06090 [Candidatus Acidiferrum sp.]
MNYGKRASILVCMACVGLACAVRVAGQSDAKDRATAPQSQAQAAPAAESWQKEFDEICSKTQNVMSYSEEQLTNLIQRCDALMPQLEKLDETRKKVYTKRLRNCRGLYAYVLESKRNDKK